MHPETPRLRLLHTSDWHLGRTLYGRKRYDEFEAFLSWLSATMEQNEVDALLLAGDVFDTGTPGNRAQELYYRFLCRTAASSCRHVVVIAGNHDSPSFLTAPGELLRSLNIHVIGGGASPEDEVLTLCDARGEPELIVCAVPCLRDRDIRSAEAGESVDDKERKLLEGIRAHYAAAGAEAERRRERLGASIPVVGMGHLFTAGGRTVDGDGVRELYVGSLAHVAAGVFPSCFDYLALGHLHVPQTVGGVETMRYSGSPLPLGFGEAGQRKGVCLIDFRGREACVRELETPTFRRLARVRGDRETIGRRLRELADANAPEGTPGCLLEVVYEGADPVGNLREELEELLAGSGVELLRIRNNRIMERVLERAGTEESLDDLDVFEVFERCLAAHEVSEELRPELVETYREAVLSLREDDVRAE